MKFACLGVLVDTKDHLPRHAVWHYYGIFCKCWAFLPLWEAPNRNMQVRFEVPLGSWKYLILCDACHQSTEFSSESRVFMVESSRKSVRFRAPKSDKGTASSSPTT